MSSNKPQIPLYSRPNPVREFSRVCDAPLSSTCDNDFDYIEEFDDNYAPIVPPYTNRGGTGLSLDKSSIPIHYPPTREIPTHIDYLSFTFSLQRLHVRRKAHYGETNHKSCDDEAIAFLSEFIGHIPYLEFKPSDKGQFGYRKSIIFYRDEQRAGLAAFDGNNDTMLVSLTGTGTSGVDMVKLRAFIARLDEIKITRVDIAHDDLEGEVPLLKFIEYYDQGLFTIRGVPPSRRMIDDFDSGSGKTLYVGKKQNGKEACIYEKGKQQGDKSSPWVRSELRLTSSDRIIPLDVLTSPSMYMAGAYPVFRKLCAFCERIEVIKKQAKIAFDSLCSYASLAYGGLINVMTSIGMSDAEIVEKLKREKTPKRLILPLLPEQVAA